MPFFFLFLVVRALLHGGLDAHCSSIRDAEKGAVRLSSWGEEW